MNEFDILFPVPEGQPGIWRCGPHRDTPTPPEVQEIVDILEDNAP